MIKPTLSSCSYHHTHTRGVVRLSSHSTQHNQNPGAPSQHCPSPYTTPSLTPNSALSSLCRNSHWGALFATCPSFLCQNLGNSNNNTNTEGHPKSYKLFLRHCACESVVKILLSRPSSYSFYYSSQRRKRVKYITEKIHYSVKDVNTARKPINSRKVESACFLG